MYCPDCGKKMKKTKSETVERGAFTETVTNYKCTRGCEREWELNYDTLNQERVFRAI